jgi:hypothetical protein
MKAHNTTLMHHMFQQKMQWIAYEVCRYENTLYLLRMPELNFNLSFEYYIEVYHQGGRIMDFIWKRALMVGARLPY